MQEFLNQLLQFLQQGIAAIFRFINLVWTWALEQITRITQVPWSEWPLWKQVLLVLVAAGVVWVLFKAAKDLWDAGEKILTAFATLLVAFVKTLPRVLVAGLIALGGLWVINRLDNNLDLTASRYFSDSETAE